MTTKEFAELVATATDSAILRHIEFGDDELDWIVENPVEGYDNDFEILVGIGDKQFMIRVHDMNEVVGS